MSVQIQQLGEVKTRGPLADMGNIKPFNRLFAGDDFIVAMSPAQAEEVVEQSFGQDAHLVTIGVHTQRAVPLG